MTPKGSPTWRVTPSGSWSCWTPGVSPLAIPGDPFGVRNTHRGSRLDEDGAFTVSQYDRSNHWAEGAVGVHGSVAAAELVRGRGVVSGRARADTRGVREWLVEHQGVRVIAGKHLVS